MPTISTFYGIMIRMYLGNQEHNPPHIHAVYQGKKALFNIKTTQKMEGGFSRDKEKLVAMWIVLHRDELLTNWQMARRGDPLFSVEPLK